MKTVVWITLLVVAWIFGSGYWAFTETGVTHFLDGWVDATLRGDAEAVCDTATKDMTFAVQDRTTGRLVKVEGGKEEFCEYVRKTTPAMAKMAPSLRVRRDDLTITRGHGLHWWTAEVSYTEHWTVSLPNGIALDTVSEDQLTLVKSFKGVYLKRLESQSSLENVRRTN